MNPVLNSGSSALLTALRGVQESQVRAADAVQRVVEGTAAQANELTRQTEPAVQEIANANQTAQLADPATVNEVIAAASEEAAPDPLQALVDLNIEKYVQAANLTAARTANEMEQTALERLV